jgi:4'-phosphopantetheinyl transferase
MVIYWLEQESGDVPGDDGWLSEAELARLSELRIPKRRNDWRLGRWTAKCAVSSFAALPVDRRDLRRVEILAAADGSPHVFIEGCATALIISLSHRAGTGACAVTAKPLALGCDLEQIEPHSPAFVCDFFTSEEQARVERARPAEMPRLIATIWSAKEAVLKALRQGLRADTRDVSIALTERVSGEWRGFQAVCRGGESFSGWWRSDERLVRTIVASPPAPPPVPLRLDTRRAITYPRVRYA